MIPKIVVNREKFETGLLNGKKVSRNFADDFDYRKYLFPKKTMDGIVLCRSVQVEGSKYTDPRLEKCNGKKVRISVYQKTIGIFSDSGILIAELAQHI